MAPAFPGLLGHIARSHEVPEKRITELTARLAGRTNAEGKPMKGYKRNVEALKAEIARLTALTGLAYQIAESQESAPGNTPP